ncbi:hypothetical protein GCM10007979_08430 [Nocardioides albus]|nr:hypothetical protein GCM10007979_08430 [Nocardioides albus]
MPTIITSRSVVGAVALRAGTAAVSEKTKSMATVTAAARRIVDLLGDSVISTTTPRVVRRLRAPRPQRPAERNADYHAQKPRLAFSS